MHILNKQIAALILTLSCVSLSAEEDKFAPISDLISTCETCHGEKGVSTIPENPILAGQEFYYMYVQLKDFQAKRRDNPIMSPMMADMEKDTMKLLAEYFSGQEWPENNHEFTAEQKKTAAKVIDAGQCVACHLGAFRGNSRVPRLANQHVVYLEKTMLDFKHKVRKNSPSKNSLLQTFSEEQISAVASYLSGFSEESEE